MNIDGVSVNKVSSQSRKFEFNVFRIIYLNDNNFCCTGNYWTDLKKKCFSDSTDN